MAASLTDLGMYYSNSGDETAMDESIGGDIGAAFDPQSVVAATALPSGVTLVGGRGLMYDGFVSSGVTARTRFVAAVKGIQFLGHGDSDFGSLIDISSDGRYLIPQDNGFPITDGRFLVIDVVAASLPGGNVITNYTITPGANLGAAMFNDTGAGITPQEQLDGIEYKYRCFYFRNDHSTDTMQNVKVYFTQDPKEEFNHRLPVTDQLAMALSVNGIYDGVTPANQAILIAEQYDTVGDLATAGHTFSTPSQASPLTIGDLQAGESIPIWFRQYVAPQSLNPRAPALNLDVTHGFAFTMELP